MGIRQWILGGIGVAIVVSAFSPDSESAKEPNKLQAAPIAPMTANERQLLTQKSTKGLAETQDKIEKVSYFEANNSTIARTKVGAYIAVGKEGLLDYAQLPITAPSAGSSSKRSKSWPMMRLSWTARYRAKTFVVTMVRTG